MKDLTALFSRRREWEWGLILTYDLNPVTFFETQLLNKIVVRRNLTVAMDSRNLRRLVEEDQAKPRFAGVYYNLEGISVRGGGSFHPKLFLFVADDEVWLASGSFNLTETGFKKNLESLIELRFVRDSLDDDGATLLNEIAGFLQTAFVDDHPLIAQRSECLRYTVQDLLSSPMFLEARAAQGGGSAPCHFLSSLDRPIMQQVLDTAGTGKWTNADVLSPFFDGDGSAIRHMASISANLRLYIPEKKSSLPASLFASDASLAEIPVFTVRLEENGFQRFCHAKVYRLQAGRISWHFVSSANLTGPGIIDSRSPRNVEIGFLFRDAKKTKFPNVPDITTERVTDFSTLAVTPGDDKPLPDDDGPQDNTRIVSAYYDAGLVRFAAISAHGMDLPMCANAQLVLDGARDRGYPIQDVCGMLQFEPELEIEGAKAIELVLVSNNGDWQTKPYPVGRRHHRPNQLPALGASAFQRCLQIGGFDGIAEAFRIAKTSGREDWLIYLLSHWDLERILHGLAVKDEQADPETDEPRTPTIRHRQVPDYTAQKLRANLDSIADSDILYDHLKSFSQGIIEESDADVITRVNDYCFPLCLEIAWGFMRVLSREERKKREHPYLRYPDYTWGHNLNKYLRFAKLAVGIFDAVTASVAWTQPEKRGHRWLFAVQTLCWIQALHTNKTYDDLSKKLRAMPALAKAMAQDADSLIEDPHVSSQLREQAREVICRYRQSETAFDNILGVLEIIDEF